MRLSGELLMHLLGKEAPLGGELEVEARLPKPFSDRDAPVFMARIRDWRLELPWLQGVFQGQALLRVHKDELQLSEVMLQSEEAVFQYQGRTFGPTPFKLTGQASRSRSSAAWNLPQVRLELGQALVLQGKAAYAPDLGLTASLSGDAPEARDLQQLLAAVLPDFLQAADASGSLGVLCNIAPVGEANVATMRLDATLQPRGLRLWQSETAGPLSGLARLEARLDHQGTPESWDMEGTLQLPAGARFKGARLALSLQGEASRAEIKTCELRPIANGAAVLSLQGAAELGESSGVVLENLRLAAEDMGSLEGRLVFDNSGLEGGMQGKGLQVAGLAAWWGRLLQSPLVGWTPKGRFDCMLELAGEASAPRVTAKLSGSGLGFASPDGSVMAEGLAFVATTETTLGDAPFLECSLQATKGGALYKTVFLDLASHPFSLHCKASFPGESRLQLRSLRAGLDGMGLVLASGVLDWKGELAYELETSASRLELEPLFKTFVAEPMAMNTPALADAVASGGAGVEMRIQGKAGQASVTGRLDVANAGFVNENQGLALEHMNLGLPFSYRFGGSKTKKAGDFALTWGVGGNTAVPSGVEAGELYIGHVRTPVGEVERLRAPVWLAENELGLEGAVELPLLGGGLELRRIRVREPFSGSFELQCQARLKELDLAALDAGPVSLQGRVAGDLGTVRLTRERLRTTGGLHGEFYGGKLEVANIAVRRPFVAGRGIGADVQVQRLHLESFSKALNLGTVNGRLNVRLQDLEVAYGEPVAFELRARSEEVDDVPQEISLQAVNAISVMGTGQGLTGAGVSMFASFFKSFSYKAIGFACILRNDVFRVRGLIKEGGVEYLIKKPALFGINVINANPDNQISFSDMKKRLERVLTPGDAKISGLAGRNQEVLQ